MVGQTTTLLYLQNMRKQLDKQIKEAEIGTGEIAELTKQDLVTKEMISIIQGNKVSTINKNNDEVLIQQLRQIIDGLMDENKKYREMYWEYRDRVDRGH